MTTDAGKDSVLEKIGVVGVVWVFSMMTVCLLLPYASSYLHLTINDADRALVNSIVSAINNAFVWVLGYLYGTSSGSRQKDATLATAVKTASVAQAAVTPAPVVATVSTPEVEIPLKEGDTATVTASAASEQEKKSE